MNAAVIVKHIAARFPLEATCFDCGAVIKPRERCYRRIDEREGYPVVVCRPWKHDARSLEAQP
ncbi:MAG TPA: hypothetical protein VJB57_04100 [Dehalococcoidia bacterium]|nr:hypothetical protein [Dehalococcoidia bacterium]